MSEKNKFKAIVVFFLVLFSFSPLVFAEEKAGEQLDLGEEYSDYNKHHGGSKHNTNKSDQRSLLVSGLLFIPNRVLDLLDIVRFDVGVGPALGAIIRVTPYGQAGVRFLMPISIRAGLRGRKSPIFVEHTNELGIGPLFLGSKEREPTPLEVGFGGDLILAGGYLGISIDSIADFFGGFVGLDISEDDL